MSEQSKVRMIDDVLRIEESTINKDKLKYLRFMKDCCILIENSLQLSKNMNALYYEQFSFNIKHKIKADGKVKFL